MALTNGSGAITERYSYSAYGKPVFCNASGTDISASAEDNRILYTGREGDTELKLYHFRARLYDPCVGRFVSYDRMAQEVGSTLLIDFSYVGNAPGNFVDPYGYFDIIPGRPNRQPPGSIDPSERDKLGGPTYWFIWNGPYWVVQEVTVKGSIYLDMCADCCAIKVSFEEKYIEAWTPPRGESRMRDNHRTRPFGRELIEEPLGLKFRTNGNFPLELPFGSLGPGIVCCWSFESEETYRVVSGNFTNDEHLNGPPWNQSKAKVINFNVDINTDCPGIDGQGLEKVNRLKRPGHEIDETLAFPPLFTYSPTYRAEEHFSADYCSGDTTVTLHNESKPYVPEALE